LGGGADEVAVAIERVFGGGGFVVARRWRWCKAASASTSNTSGTTSRPIKPSQSVREADRKTMRSGHWLIDEAPEQVLPALVGFIN
jgi:hypothetical protein